jgi:hypothetical protein
MAPQAHPVRRRMIMTDHLSCTTYTNEVANIAVRSVAYIITRLGPILSASQPVMSTIIT